VKNGAGYVCAEKIGIVFACGLWQRSASIVLMHCWNVSRRFRLLTGLTLGVAFTGYPAAAADNSRVTITVIEKATAKPMPARIHLKDSSGKPHQPKDLPFWRDHFVCAGEAKLELVAGDYTIEVERGPEFSAHRGEFHVAAGTSTNITATLDRIVDLAAEGWWSGELHVHRPIADAELLMSAEDLHVAQFITWWNKQNLWSNSPPANPLRQFGGNRFAHVLAGEDEREGGARAVVFQHEATARHR
jgi:hypothetical protein